MPVDRQSVITGERAVSILEAGVSHATVEKKNNWRNSTVVFFKSLKISHYAKQTLLLSNFMEGQ